MTRGSPLDFTDEQTWQLSELEARARAAQVASALEAEARAWPHLNLRVEKADLAATVWRWHERLLAVFCEPDPLNADSITIGADCRTIGDNASTVSAAVVALQGIALRLNRARA